MTRAEFLATYTRPTLIEVMASHCAECRAMQPDLAAVAAEHAGTVDLVVLDASRHPDEIAQLGVMGTPTLIAVKDGVETARFTGRRSRSDLRELFAAVAAGQAGNVSRTGTDDRNVRTVAGILLAGAALFMGPNLLLVAAGALLVGWANFSRRGNRLGDDDSR